MRNAAMTRLVSIWLDTAPAFLRRFQENKYPQVPGTSRTSLPELQNTDSLGQKVPGTFAVYFII